ncbi:MAG: phage protease [Flavipsychrobacter sp.]
MKKVTLVLNEALYNSLGLQNGASDEAIAEAVHNGLQKAAKVDALEDSNKLLKQEKETLQNKLDALEASATTEKVDSMLNTAVDEGKLTNEAKEAYKEQFAKNPEGLAKVLNALKPYNPVSDKLKDKGDEPTNKALIEEYDKAFEDGTLNEIKNTDMDKYKAMYKAKFKKEYKGE